MWSSAPCAAHPGKSDLYLVALLWKMICNLGDPMNLRHPVEPDRLNILTIGLSNRESSSYTCLCVCICVCMCVFMCIYTYTYVYPHICIYICAYTSTLLVPIKRNRGNSSRGTHQKARKQAGVRESTGWRRLIGFPKLQIIFHKRAIKNRSLLRKMTYKDEGSYESSPPCNKKRSKIAREKSYTQTHTHTHTHTHTYTQRNTHTQQMHTHTCARTHIYTHTHAHIQLLE